MKSLLFRILESILAWLARGDTQLVRLFEFVLALTAPALAARVEFRRGNLSAAKRLAQNSPNSLVSIRSCQMLDCLAKREFPIGEKTVYGISFNHHVLFVVHSSGNFDPNGYSVRSMQILSALEQHGIATTVTTRLGYPWDLRQHSKQPVVQESVISGIRWQHKGHPHGLRQPELNYIEDYAQYLTDMVEDCRCSVIHSHSNFLNGLAGAVAARRSGCRSVYEMRGLWHLTRATNEPSYEATEHFAYCDAMEVFAAKASDEVIVISEALRDWLTSFGVDRARITVVGNAASQIMDIGKRRFKLEDGLLHIGYLGALTTYEGIQVLLEAVKLLLERGIVVKATVVGDGPDAKHLRKATMRLGLENSVKFAGRVPASRVPAFYEDFDVCVIPRVRCAVTEMVPPLKPFEIMANGVPMVVSDLAPLEEIVRNGHRGLVFEAGSPVSLAGTLERMALNSEERERLAKTAHAWVVEEATWNANAERYLAVYEGT